MNDAFNALVIVARIYTYSTFLALKNGFGRLSLLSQIQKICGELGCSAYLDRKMIREPSSEASSQDLALPLLSTAMLYKSRK